MRNAIAILLLSTVISFGQTNVIVGTVADYGLAIQTNVLVTATKLYPPRRSVSGVLIREDPVLTYTDTNGAFSFTNFLWGKYQLTVDGENGTSFNIWVNTNTVGTNIVTDLLVPITLTPVTNYYTIGAADALFAAIQNGNVSNLTAYGLTIPSGYSVTNLSASSSITMVSTDLENGSSTIAFDLSYNSLPEYQLSLQIGTTNFLVQTSEITTNYTVKTTWQGDSVQSGDLDIYGGLILYDTFQMLTGAGDGNVLISDSAGMLTLQTPPWTQSTTVILTNSSQRILEWAAAGAYQVTNSVVDSDGVIVTAGVVWPDGGSGTFTTTSKDATWLAINAYRITRPDGATVIQSELSRNSNTGAATNIPPLTIEVP